MNKIITIYWFDHLFMKYFDSSKLTKDFLFVLVIFLGVFFGLGSAIAITIHLYNTNGLQFSTSPQGFSNFLTYYEFPFKVFTITGAILGLVAMLHRSKQTAIQINESIKQNIHNNYFSHLKDFKEQLYKVDFNVLKPINMNILYKEIFPNNSPSYFDPTGTTLTLINQTDNFAYSYFNSANVLINKILDHDEQHDALSGFKEEALTKNILFYQDDIHKLLLDQKGDAKRFFSHLGFEFKDATIEIIDFKKLFFDDFIKLLSFCEESSTYMARDKTIQQKGAFILGYLSDYIKYEVMIYNYKKIANIEQ